MERRRYIALAWVLFGVLTGVGMGLVARGHARRSVVTVDAEPTPRAEQAPPPVPSRFGPPLTNTMAPAPPAISESPPPPVMPPAAKMVPARGSPASDAGLPPRDAGAPDAPPPLPPGYRPPVDAAPSPLVPSDANRAVLQRRVTDQSAVTHSTFDEEDVTDQEVTHSPFDDEDRVEHHPTGP